MNVSAHFSWRNRSLASCQLVSPITECVLWSTTTLYRSRIAEYSGAANLGLIVFGSKKMPSSVPYVWMKGAAKAKK